MKKTMIWTIAKKEFLSFFNTPLSFVIIVPFLFISTFIYLRTSLIVGEASMRSYFELLPWFLILLAPALSMKLITDERTQGTLELLYAHPLTEIDIVIGKFLGTWLFYIVILATTLPIPLALLLFANPDPGILLSQYIGGIVLGGMFLSIGIAASTYVMSPIGSFLIAASASFSLLLLGLDFVSLLVPAPFNRIVSELAVNTHMTTIARGALDIRDGMYFLSMTGIMLLVAVIKISERKTAEDPAERRKSAVALTLLVGIGIALNVILSWYPLRLDLTQQRLFTLSPGTRQTLSSLPDLVTLTIYTTSNLPSPLQLTLKEIQDTLADYAKYGKNVQVVTKYTDTDPAAQTAAQNDGIQEVTFNKMGGGKFEVQNGMLGLAIRYGSKIERLPYIQDTTDLEYQVTRRIRKLISKKPTTIGIFAPAYSQHKILDSLLNTEYATFDFSVDDVKDKMKTASLSALLVYQDGSDESSIAATIASTTEQIKNVLLLSDGVTVNQQFMSGTKSNSDINTFLSAYGVKINNDLVYDLEQNETLTFGGNGQVRYVAPYPFWLRAIPSDDPSGILSGVKSVTLGWPSSLSLEQKDGVTQHVLLTTGQNAGTQTDGFQVDPTKSNLLTIKDQKKIPLAVSVEKKDTHLIVVADSDLASEQMLQNFSENATFLISAIDTLVSDKDVGAIPKKSAARAVYSFSSPLQPIIFQYGTMFIPSLAVIGFAIYWLSRRKKRTQRKLVIKS